MVSRTNWGGRRRRHPWWRRLQVFEWLEIFRGLGPSPELDDVDEVTEDLIAQTPAMFMMPADEKQARREVLYKTVLDAEVHGTSNEGSEQLRQLVLAERFDVFRRALTGDMPADVELMLVHLKPDARAVRAKPRAYPLCTSAWLAWHMDRLAEAGMVYRNDQATYGIVAMAIPKVPGKDSYGLVSD